MEAKLYYPLTENDGPAVILVTNNQEIIRAYAKDEADSDEEFRISCQYAIKKEFKNKVSIQF
jgi:hypothetical protein